MSKFDWLEDGALWEAYTEMKQAMERCTMDAGGKVTRNVLDPFAAAMHADLHSHYGAEDVWAFATGQAMEGCLKSIPGKFHERLLARAKGWGPGEGTSFDVASVGRSPRVVAEIKNKHNTVSKSALKGLLRKLADLHGAMPRGTVVYYVPIVPKTPERYDRQVGVNGVRECDGATFYHLVSGRPDAIHEVLDQVMEWLCLDRRVCGYLRELPSLPPRVG